MKHKITQKKLMFIHQLANLPEQALGRQVIDIKIEKGIGLYKECVHHLTAMRVTDLSDHSK